MTAAGDLIRNLEPDGLTAAARRLALDAWADDLADLTGILLAGVTARLDDGATIVLDPVRLEQRVGILVGQALELGALAARTAIADAVDEVLALDAAIGHTGPMTDPTTITTTATATLTGDDLGTLVAAHGGLIGPDFLTGLAAAVRAGVLSALEQVDVDVAATPGARLTVARSGSGGMTVDDGTTTVADLEGAATVTVAFAPEAAATLPAGTVDALLGYIGAAVSAEVAALGDLLDLTEEQYDLIDLAVAIDLDASGEGDVVGA